jgi:hypothetical protein
MRTNDVGHATVLRGVYGAVDDAVFTKGDEDQYWAVDEAVDEVVHEALFGARWGATGGPTDQTPLPAIYGFWACAVSEVALSDSLTDADKRAL